MRNLAKTIYKHLPRSGRVFSLRAYEYMYFLKTKRLVKAVCLAMPKSVSGRKPKILFYHISGLSFGGTEKFLQIIAKYIDKKKYEVFYMYSAKPRSSSGNIKLDGRLPYISVDGITPIPFTYDELAGKYPYFIKGMSPTLPEVIENNDIDTIITAGSGYTEFPINIVRNIPIIMLNIFGSPSVQNNIKKHVCISYEVAEKIRPVVAKEKIDIMYIQSEPINSEKRAAYEISGKELRKRFGISDSDFVFGRIGRADDGIFDPIGINAFKKVVAEDKGAHYIIMSSPPVLRKIVDDEKIPNVHFIDPSAEEKDVWAFHFSIDALAHFRLDGESFGLNIAESMLAGKPILSHKSNIWNAHLEYLDQSFSFVVNKDDVDGYARNMKKIIEMKKSGTIDTLNTAAREKAESLFLIDRNINRIEAIVDESLVK